MLDPIITDRPTIMRGSCETLLRLRGELHAMVRHASRTIAEIDRAIDAQNEETEESDDEG